jgi:hypothetical protein
VCFGGGGFLNHLYLYLRGSLGQTGGGGADGGMEKERQKAEEVFLFGVWGGAGERIYQLNACLALLGYQLLLINCKSECVLCQPLSLHVEHAALSP